jgi:DNA primase
LIGGENVPSKKIDDRAVFTKFYQQAIKGIQRSKNGKAYAESRNLNYEKLQIGFSSYEMGKSWGDEIKKRAIGLGLLKIKNCLIFPMKDKEGNIVSVYGRSIAYQSKVKHFYLKGGYKGLYPKYPTGEMKRLILTESIIDAAVLYEYLVIENECPELSQTEILALYGTNGWTKEHEQVVKEATKLEEVILFFDGDEAGIKAVEKYGDLIKNIRPELTISKVDTPLKEDVNSLIIGHYAMILESLLMNRTSCASTPLSDRSSASTSEAIETEIQASGILHTNKVDLLRYETESLDISILGGIKVTGLDRLKVTVKIIASTKKNALPIRHSLDLYHVKQVEQLTQKISESFELRSNEVEKILSELTGELERYREERIEEMKPKKKERIQLTTEEKRAALNYLKDKKLLRNTLTDIAKTGIVGEVNNSLIAYLAYTSRKREKPLHIMCLGASGMGKTYLQEKVSELIPDEEKIEITSLSDNALYYFGREALKQKLILIEDLDGAQNVLYPLRELQSKRRISKTVTLKDNKGKLNTVNLVVEGPVCVSGCTTKERIYEDNANR